MVYAGSIERIDFGEEREDKGFVWVQVEKGRATYDFIPCQRGASSPSASMPVPATCFSSSIRRCAPGGCRCGGTGGDYRTRRADVVDDRLLRQRLQEAYLIAGITKEVVKASVRTRDASLTETLGPLRSAGTLPPVPPGVRRPSTGSPRAGAAFVARTAGGTLGMIPLRLRLHNFMSYGENVPPLDFSQITTACMTGDNGHGNRPCSMPLPGRCGDRHGRKISTMSCVLDRSMRKSNSSSNWKITLSRHTQAQPAYQSRPIIPGTARVRCCGNRYQAISGNSIRDTEAKIVQLLQNYSLRTLSIRCSFCKARR